MLILVKIKRLIHCFVVPLTAEARSDADKSSGISEIVDNGPSLLGGGSRKMLVPGPCFVSLFARSLRAAVCGRLLASSWDVLVASCLALTS